MKLLKREHTIAIFVIMLGIIVGLSLALMYHVQKNNAATIELSIRNGEDSAQAEVSVAMDKSKSWLDRTPYPDSKKDQYGMVVAIIGAQFDGIIYNNTDAEICNWTLTMHLPMKGGLDSSWNGEYEMSGDGMSITLHPDEFIGTIPAHKEKTFGFVLKTEEEIDITDFSFEGHVQKGIREYPLYWGLWIAIIAWNVALVTYVIMQLKIQTLEDRRRRDEEIISQTMMTFAGLIDAKDEYTKGHSVRVSQYTMALAKRMKMSEEKIRQLGYIALMHDSGKMGVPDIVLKKPDRLTEAERKVIESHTTLGGKVLENFSAIDGIRDGALYHHERYDGKGYPTGLVGEKIPLCARIICVADSFDAMNSDRCYRKHLSKEQILSELEKNKGLQFDPVIVQHMIDMLSDGSIKAMEDFL